MGQTWPLFVYFRPFLNTMSNIGRSKFHFKSLDGVLGIQTRDSRMACADKSTELWQPLMKNTFTNDV